jgi:hypothetical protein
VHGSLLRRWLRLRRRRSRGIDFTVERECLQDDIEALAVLVLEHEPMVEPEVILAFTPDDGSAQPASMRRLVRHATTRKLGIDGHAVTKYSVQRPP